MEPSLYPIQTFRGHDGGVQEVVFSKNDSEVRVISTSNDETVRIWDVQTGNQVGMPFQGHGCKTVGLAVSMNGRRVVSGAKDGKILIWDAETKEIIRCLSHHTGCAGSIQFSPDEKRLVSASDDGSLKIWTVETGELVFNIDDHQDKVWTVAYSPDGTKIASGCLDGTIHIWSSVTGKQHAQPVIHNTPVSSVVWSPDSSLLICATDDGRIYFYFCYAQTSSDVQLECFFHAHSDPINSLAISSNTELMASASSDRTARLWSTTTRKPFGRVLQHAGSVSTVAFSPNSQLVATGAGDMIFLWNILSNESIIVTTHVVPPPSSISPASHITSGLDQPSASSHYMFMPHAASLGNSISSSSRTTATLQQDSQEYLVSLSSSLQDLTNRLTGISAHPIASGGFGDIWRCYLLIPNGTVRVAVKAIRAFESDDNIAIRQKAKRVHRELKVWGRLKHGCILPLWGVASNFGPYPAMICPWADTGALTGFLERQHNMLSFENRFSLLIDIALGLQYLHSKSVIHGDLTGSNVLIYRNGRACLADFGLSTIMVEFVGTSYFTNSITGNIRWAAIELFEITEGDEECESSNLLSTECDIYSFGSITLQVLTGKVPYCNVKKDTLVLGHVIRGKKPDPPKESQIGPAHWEFIKRCWSPRVNRPSVGEVLTFVVCERQAFAS
jgi:WD40 repeat protein